MIYINQDEDGYVLVCDVCGAEASEVFPSFEMAIEFKKDKENGWKSVKTKIIWEDRCPYCVDQ